MTATRLLSRSLLRTTPRIPLNSTRIASRTLPAITRYTFIRLAHSDYGSGDGNPAGETPEKQGKNPSEHLEHPGPPPPDVGKGTGGPDATEGKSSAGGSESGKKAQGGEGSAAETGSSTAEKGGQLPGA